MKIHKCINIRNIPNTITTSITLDLNSIDHLITNIYGTEGFVA